VLRRLIVLAGSYAFWAGGGCRRASGAVVLCYHGVADAYAGRFRKQMDILARRAHVVDAAERECPSNGPHRVALTFDDALASFKENALPVLQQHRFPSTIFVPTGYIGKACTWMRSPEQYEREEGHAMAPRDREQFLSDAVMDEDDLRALGGRVAIGSHGVRHLNLARLADDEMEREIVESKHMLERLTGKPVGTISLPHGGYKPATLTACRRHGYHRVFLIEPGFAFLAPDEFLTPRVVVDPSDWPCEFRLKALGAYGWLSRLTGKRRPARGPENPGKRNHAHG